MGVKPKKRKIKISSKPTQQLSPKSVSPPVESIDSNNAFRVLESRKNGKRKVVKVTEKVVDFAQRESDLQLVRLKKRLSQVYEKEPVDYSASKDALKMANFYK